MNRRMTWLLPREPEGFCKGIEGQQEDIEVTRRGYQRLGVDARRSALLGATLDCLAEDGMGGASVRSS